MPCSWAWGPQALGIAAYAAALWWTVRYSVRDAAANKQRQSAVTARIYVARRIQLHNARGLRAAQLCAGILYAAIMAYLYLIVSPNTLTSSHVLGLLLTNFYILVTCCCTVVGLVPYCEKLLLEYNPVVSVVSVGSLALFTNYTGLTRLAIHNSFVANILAYDVLWLLEDCPLRAYLPMHLAVVGVHFASQRCLSTAWNLPALALAYAGLGVVVPIIASGLLLPSNSQARVPTALHTVIAATVVGYLLLDQLLRAPLLTEPLQDMAERQGDLLLRGLVSMLAPRAEGARYRYGLAEHTGLGLMYSTLALSLVSALLSALSEGDGGAFNGLANRTFLASLSKNSAASYLLTMLRGMSASKKAAVVAIGVILMLQLLGMASVAFEVVLHGPESLVRTAPTVLLGVMMGCMLQVGGVLYILLGPSDVDGPSEAAAGASVGAGVGGPGAASLETTAPATVAISETETVSRSTSVGGGMMTPTAAGLGGGGSRSLLTRANVLAQDTLLEGVGVVGTTTTNSGQNVSGVSGGVAGMMDSYSMLSGLSRGPSERLSAVDTLDDNALDLRTRIEALGNFKTFMQGLDQQPGVYSLEEFIRGAATAIRGIFPGVAHASFCLLNQTRNCVNMYTFLGDGSRKPPRINVTVAPGTLIYHVLHNCQPVFISNVAAFPGPYADVQFMRFVLNLRSVACLPLVVAGSRVLGVLRLGFEEQWNWTEQEKGIAKQLALVLSSTSNGMHVYGGGGVAVGGMQPGVGAGGLGGNSDSNLFESPGHATATAAAMAAAKYPNVAAVLAANQSERSAGGGSAPQALMQDDPDGLAYARTQPLGPALQMPGVPMHQLYSGVGGAGGGSGVMGPGGTAGVGRRLRQSSRSSMQFPAGYPAVSGSGMSLGMDPGSGNGLDMGVGSTGVSGAHTVLAAGGSSRSSMDFHAYYSSVAGVGGGGGPMGQAPYADIGLSPLGMSPTAAAAASGGLGMGMSMSMGQAGMSPGAAGGMGGLGGPMGSMGLAPGAAGMGGLDEMYRGSAYGGVGGGGGGGGGGMVSMQSNLSSGGGPTAPRMRDSSGSGQQLTASEIDETWLLQQPGSAQVRRALAKPAQAQGHGAGADIKMLEVIGRGGFGSVYKAFWRGMVVAVKVLEHEDEMLPCSGGSGSQTKVDTSSRRAALLEGAMTSTISHPHVVQTYDYRVVTLDPQSSLNGITRSRVLHETHIIMEFCDRGSLQDAIEQGVFVVDGPRGARGVNTEPEVDMELIIMTLAEVSNAMEYLHKHRITHRDLKPKNILLRSSAKDRRGYVSKVSDFGLSQVLPDTNKTQVSTKYSGTVTHMAPELIEDGKVYQQGDVYAFGIIMWEIYTSSTPYQSMAHPQIMVGVVTHNLRPKFPTTCPEWYKNLAYRCWRKDPKTRPPFAEVTRTLLGMLEDKEWKPS